jgi:AcrR family transcriptional regulator
MKKVTYGPARRTRGRPRSFDREQALDAAMNVFWSKGFEGASLSELTEAMGINPPSLYAAFGDKEGLFVEAVRRYHSKVQESCPYQDQATARASIERLLTDLASIFTDPQHPKGCLAVMAATTSASAGPKLQELLAEQRNQAKARLRERIGRGVKDGDLPADTDVVALTNFYAAVINGMSLQARDGVTRKGLLAMVETAMRAWPEAPRQASRKERAVHAP